MKLNTKRLDRSCSESRNTGGGGGGFYRLVDGRNILRIFTFNHTVTKADFKKGLYKKSDDIEVGEDYDEIERAVPRHFTDEGIINCTPGDCEHCDKANDLKDSKDKDDQKLYKQIRATIGYYVNVVNVEDEESGMQVCPFPPSVFNEILTYIMDPEYGEEILGCKGRDFIIDRDSKASPANMYKIKLREAKRCEKLDEDLADDVTDLFDFGPLEPGFDSNSSDDEKKEKKKEKGEDEERPRGKKRNPFKDKEKGGEDEVDDTLPWETPEWFEKGAEVEFEDDDGNTLRGKVKSTEPDGEEYDIDVDGDVWGLKLSELTPVKKSKKKDSKKKKRKR